MAKRMSPHERANRRHVGRSIRLELNDAWLAGHRAGARSTRLSAAQRRVVEDIKSEAAFLLDRIAEAEESHLPGKGRRDWCGHVHPSIARLRDLLERAKGDRK